MEGKCVKSPYYYTQILEVVLYFRQLSDWFRIGFYFLYLQTGWAMKGAKSEFATKLECQILVSLPMKLAAF